MSKVTEEPKVNSCPEFPHFGATYPDATCIDGYLWDLDSGTGGMVTQGGNDPCPFCNTEAFLDWFGVDEEDSEAPKREEVLADIEKLRLRYS